MTIGHHPAANRRNANQGGGDKRREPPGHDLGEKASHDSDARRGEKARPQLDTQLTTSTASTILRPSYPPDSYEYIAHVPTWCPRTGVEPCISGPTYIPCSTPK